MSKIIPLLFVGAVMLSLSTQVHAQAATDVDCDECVDQQDLAYQSISSAKIKKHAVKRNKIANNAVGTSQIDPTQVQIRVAGSCAVGSFVAAVNEDGSTTCETGAFTFYNSRYGLDALASNTSGWYNTASGHNTLFSNTSGNSNTASGAFALFNNVDGGSNTATGDRALADNSDGQGNTAVGAGALRKNTSGQGNTAVGNDALRNKVTGWNNIALGQFAGNGLTAGDLNIYIQNSGTDTESNTIRVGTQNMQLRTFMAGIVGTTTDVGDAIGVVIDSNGQLGTISSSVRNKEDIQDMGSSSDRLLQLRPVTFRYKEAYANGDKPVQYGLIAEEVADVLPDLVVYDDEGAPETVKYRLLSSLLLNEVQKQHGMLQSQGLINQTQRDELTMLKEEVAELRRLVGQIGVSQVALRGD